MRLLCLVVGSLMVLGQASAMGEEMMLERETPTSFTGWGWTFLLLTAATLSYGQTAKKESEEALANANTSYTSYQGASTATDAESFRLEAQGFLNDAQVLEVRANLAFYMTLLFGLTTYYSFFPEHLPDNTILVSHRGILFQHRF